MGQIQLTRPNCEALLQDAGTEPGMRAVAALGVAFFEVNDQAGSSTELIEASA